MIPVRVSGRSVRAVMLRLVERSVIRVRVVVAHGLLPLWVRERNVTERTRCGSRSFSVSRIAPRSAAVALRAPETRHIAAGRASDAPRERKFQTIVADPAFTAQVAAMFEEDFAGALAVVASPTISLQDWTG